MKLPPPSAVLNSSKFAEWFPGQEDLVAIFLQWLKGPKRFMCANVPTGFGKSMIAEYTAWINGKKCVYVTNTKALQEQLSVDFGHLGLVDVRGQNSYECVLKPPTTVDRGICHSNGGICGRKGDCTYYQALAIAKHSRLVVTNYAYWLAQNFYGDGIVPDKQPPPGLVVMDEGHLAGPALETHITINLSDADLEELGMDYDCVDWEWAHWQERAAILARRLANEVEELEKQIKEDPDEGKRRKHQTLERLCRSMMQVRDSKVEWIVDDEGGVSLCPLWPRDYKERLFIGDKILLMSATLTKKSIEKLGIDEEDYEWVDWPSPFDPAKSPIYHIDTLRVEYRTPPENMGIWARRIDQVIEGRLDRKGIISTTSYDRADLLLRHTEFSHLMFTHGRGNTEIGRAVRHFRASDPPGILVSPAITSGWDFPGEDCEYIIIGKVPFVSTQGKLMKARKEDDPEWPNFLAMETLVQIAGRGTRSQEDRCEIFIMDNHWGDWFWRKNQEFAPRWFQDRVMGTFGQVPGVPNG